MLTRVSRLLVGIFLPCLVLAACGESAERRVAELPAQLELGEESLFSVDTETERFEVPVAGVSGEAVAAVLADRSGRRRLELARGPYGGEQVRSAGWVLLAAAARSQSSLCVCWSELTGTPSTLTTGDLPDPTEGMDLLCRFRTPSGWSNPVDLAPGAPSAWIQAVTVAEEGFEVRYRRDSGWLLLDTAPEDGSYTRLIVPGESPGPHIRVDNPSSAAGGEQP